MSDISVDEATGTMSADVTVTNTGQVAGKDVVQIYDNPPYTDGGIEKSAANLLTYNKTKLLEPGETQTITVTGNATRSPPTMQRMPRPTCSRPGTTRSPHVPTPTNFAMSDANKANFVATSNYDASADDAASTATMPTTGSQQRPRPGRPGGAGLRRSEVGPGCPSKT